MQKTIIAIFALGLMSLGASGQQRGMYFAKKAYEPVQLPTFTDSRNALPEPIYDENPEWVSMYWRAWEIAFSRITAPQPGSPFVSAWIDEALSPQIFQWDTHFMAMFGRYAHHIFPFINSHDNFYCCQHPDGMICRVINEDDGSDHWWGKGPDNARAINPPLFTWAEISTYMVTGDKSRFELIFPALEKYVEWIEKNRSGDDTPHRLFWSNGQASGMDNTPRDLSRPEPEGGWNCHSAFDHVGWVDMSSQMVMCYDGLAYIAQELDDKGKAKLYNKKAKQIARLINKWMWNDSQGFYMDVDVEGRQTSWVTIASFWPMLAQVASPKQAMRLHENLCNPELFWSRIPVPTLAMNQPEYDKMGKYWRGGVWAPTNYMVVEGLKKYGYRDTAVELTKKYLDALYQVYASTGTLWETYSPEIYCPATNATGIAMVMRDFVGWTGLGPISMLLETLIGVEMDAPANTLHWHIVSNKRCGVENLTFCGARVDLVAEPQEGAYVIRAKSEREITLDIMLDSKEVALTVPANKEIKQHIII